MYIHLTLVPKDPSWSSNGDDAVVPFDLIRPIRRGKKEGEQNVQALFLSDSQYLCGWGLYFIE